MLLRTAGEEGKEEPTDSSEADDGGDVALLPVELETDSEVLDFSE